MRKTALRPRGRRIISSTVCKSLFTLMLGAIALVGCQQPTSDPKDLEFLSVFPIADINGSLILSSVSGESSYAVDETIDLKLENLSGNIIVFPPDFGVRGFIYDAGAEEWVDVPNRIEYLSTLKRAMGYSGSEYPSVGIVTFAPDLDQGTTPTMLRIAVVGNVMRNGLVTDDLVAAYHDVTLLP